MRIGTLAVSRLTRSNHRKPGMHSGDQLGGLGRVDLESPGNRCVCVCARVEL